MRVFYNDDYVAMKHSVDATRKPAWVAESLKEVHLRHVNLASPDTATREQILRVHSSEYVHAVEFGRPRRLAESCTFPWDAGTWKAELASCGGMIAACNAAIVDGASASLSVGFHHSAYSRGSNHCVFNGLAVAMSEMRQHGIERVICIDMDAHCGGGTYSLMKDVPGFHQLDISLFWTDKYVPTNTATLDLIENPEDYLSTLRIRLNQLASILPEFQLCLYYAGMDPHEGSGFGGLPGITNEVLCDRDRLVFETMARCKVPVAIAPGGGYLGSGLDKSGLVQLHRKTIELAEEICTTHT